MSPTSIPRLSDPNRLITDTKTSGKAMISPIHPAPLPVVKDLDGTLFRLGYVTPPPLANLTSDIDAYAAHLKSPPPLLVPGGSNVVWYIDTPPNSASPLHRTVSLDIVVLLEGEIELTLDGGDIRLLKPGDMVVQRATMHLWRNPSADRWARMVGIMVECRPVEIEGMVLGTEFPSH